MLTMKQSRRRSGPITWAWLLERHIGTPSTMNMEAANINREPYVQLQEHTVSKPWTQQYEQYPPTCDNM
jgi:hypothetical protein